MSDINHFDIVFVVDTTGSMGTFMSAAKRLMISTADSLARNENVDMRIGLVQYRDHPPQDTVLTQVHQLKSPDLAQKEINSIGVTGGGDGPEAVLDGIKVACEKIKWRKHSRKVAVLIGDAPPHGCGGMGDGFPKGCPCGETIESVSAAMEIAGITLYAIVLSSSMETHKAFGQLAQLTGGDCFDSSGAGAIDKIQQILNNEFGNLKLDKKVLDAWDAEATTSSVSDKIGETISDVAGAYMRLTRRGLIANDQVLV